MYVYIFYVISFICLIGEISLNSNKTGETWRSFVQFEFLVCIFGMARATQIDPKPVQQETEFSVLVRFVSNGVIPLGTVVITTKTRDINWIIGLIFHLLI